MKVRSKVVSLCLVVAMLIFTAYQGIKPVSLQQDYKQEQMLTKNKDTIHLWYTDEALTDYLGSCALSYMEEHENVRVVPTLVSAVEYVEQIYNASLLQESLPDLFIVTNDCLEKAYLSGLATEISEKERIADEQNFPDTAIAAATYKGEIVAYPFYFETSLFLYNKSFLESMAVAKAEALADEEEGLRAQAEADARMEEGQQDMLSLTEAAEENLAQNDEEKQNTVQEEIEEEYEEGQSILDSISEEIQASLIPQTFHEILALADEYDAPENVEAILRWDVSDLFYNYFFAGNYMNIGGETGDDEGQIDIYNEKTVECLEVYQGLNQFFSIDAKETDYDKVLTDFMEGRTIFTVATTDAIGKLEQAKTDGSFVWDYAIAPIPDVTRELKSKGLSVTDVIAVNGFGKHREIANDFAAYLVTRTDGELYKRAGKLSAYKKVIHDNEMMDLVMEAYAGSTSLPKLIRASNFWLQLEAAYTDIWNGKDTGEVLSSLEEQMLHQIQGKQQTVSENSF